MSVHSFTNVWFGGGYGIFSDPDGDRRHFNRDVYGIWFTSLSSLKHIFRAYLGSPIQDMHWTNQGQKRLVSSIQVQSCFALNLQTLGVALSYFSF